MGRGRLKSTKRTLIYERTDLGATFDVDRGLFPFTSHFMEMSNGAKLHYVDEVKGDLTFLMLHGKPIWSFLNRKLISGLAPDHRCVALDYPGYYAGS